EGGLLGGDGDDGVALVVEGGGDRVEEGGAGGGVAGGVLRRDERIVERGLDRELGSLCFGHHVVSRGRASDAGGGLSRRDCRGRGVVGRGARPRAAPCVGGVRSASVGSRRGGSG